MTSAREVNNETIACIDAGMPVWDGRTLAYWRAYRRRLLSEVGPRGGRDWSAPASKCLITLARAMQNRVLNYGANL